MGKYLYEKVKEKGLDATKLPIRLAYSISYQAKEDRLMGSVVVTYKAVQTNKN